MDEAIKELVDLCSALPAYLRAITAFVGAEGHRCDCQRYALISGSRAAIIERAEIIDHMAREIMSGRSAELVAELEAMRRGLNVGALAALLRKPAAGRLDS